MTYNLHMKPRFPDIRKKIKKNTAAIMVETILGEGGIKQIPDKCLKYLRKLCNKKGILLILDDLIGAQVNMRSGLLPALMTKLRHGNISCFNLIQNIMAVNP